MLDSRYIQYIAVHRCQSNRDRVVLHTLWWTFAPKYELAVCTQSDDCSRIADVGGVCSTRLRNLQTAMKCSLEILKYFATFIWLTNGHGEKQQCKTCQKYQWFYFPTNVARHGSKVNTGTFTLRLSTRVGRLYTGRELSTHLPSRVGFDTGRALYTGPRRVEMVQCEKVSHMDTGRTRVQPRDFS